jgi:phosphopantetheine adenylyltransferase
MEPIEVRTANVDKFLTTFKRGLKYDLPTIHDPYGPTKWDPKLQAIVGSRETFQGCVAVNEERKKADLSLVDIYIIDVISSSKANVADMKEKLSSTDFRLWVNRFAVEILFSNLMPIIRYLEKRKREALEHEKEEHEHGEHAVHAAS